MTARHLAGPLLTDLYEITMAAGYWDHEVQERATFSVFVRNPDQKRNFFVAAGMNCARINWCFAPINRSLRLLGGTGLTRPSDTKIDGSPATNPKEDVPRLPGLAFAYRNSTGRVARGPLPSSSKPSATTRTAEKNSRQQYARGGLRYGGCQRRKVVVGDHQIINVNVTRSGIGIGVESARVGDES